MDYLFHLYSVSPEKHKLHSLIFRQSRTTGKSVRLRIFCANKGLHIAIYFNSWKFFVFHIACIHGQLLHVNFMKLVMHCSFFFFNRLLNTKISPQKSFNISKASQKQAQPYKCSGKQFIFTISVER